MLPLFVDFSVSMTRSIEAMYRNVLIILFDKTKVAPG